MSFALTERQLMAGEKDVTRRLGWLGLREGDDLTAVRKCMGLAKGEKQVRLGSLVVLRVRRERLDTITADECRREGFPDMTPAEFVAFFCKANRCEPETIVTRIEFRATLGSAGGGERCGLIGLAAVGTSRWPAPASSADRWRASCSAASRLRRASPCPT